MERRSVREIRTFSLSSSGWELVPTVYEYHRPIKVGSAAPTTSSDVIKGDGVEFEGKSRKLPSHLRKRTSRLTSSRKAKPNKFCYGMQNHQYNILEFQDEETVDRFKIGLHKWMETPTRVRWCDRNEDEYTYSLCTLQDNDENCPLRKCRIRDSCSTYTEACCKLAALTTEETSGTPPSPPYLPSHEGVDLGPQKRLRISTISNKDYEYCEENHDYDYFSQLPRPLISLKGNIIRPDLRSESCSECGAKSTMEVSGTSSSSFLTSEPVPQFSIDLDKTPTTTSLEYKNPVEQTREGKMLDMLKDMQKVLSENAFTQGRVIELLSNQSTMLESLVTAVNSLKPDNPEDLVPFKVPISNAAEMEQANKELIAPSVQRGFAWRIALIGGPSMTAMINNIVDFLFTKSFAKELHGRHTGESNSIYNTLVMKQIAVGVRIALNDNTVDDYQVFKIVTSRLNTIRSSDERKQKSKILGDTIKQDIQLF